MTNISASLPTYTPPVVSAPVQPPAPVDPTANKAGDNTSTQNADTVPSNANNTTAGVYTALADVNASTIRGTTINTAA